MKPKKPAQKPSSERKQAARRKPEETGRARTALPWRVDAPGVWIERDPATNGISMVRHPTHPYVPDPHPDLDWKEPSEELLHGIGFTYLKAVNRALGFLPRDWLAGLELRSDDGMRPLRWLRLQLASRRSLPGVWWLDRYDDAASKDPQARVDRTAVLLAGFALDEGQTEIQLLGGQGISVIAHLDRLEGGQARVRITGLFNTLPVARESDAGIVGAVLKRFIMSARLREDFRRDALREFGLDPKVTQVAEVGVRVPQALFASPRPEVPYVDMVAKTVLLRRPDGTARTEEVPWALVGRIWDWPSPPGYRFEAVSKRPLSAHADAAVYVQDPISRRGLKAFRRLRPNRSWRDLDAERETRQFPELVPVAGRVALTMNDAAGKPLFTVTRSPFVDRVGEADRNDAEELDVSVRDGRDVIDEHVRSNEFAAINAYFRAREFFNRLVGYGFPPRQYFRFVELPLLMRYRAGVNPGATDGRTINAQVRFSPKWLVDAPEPKQIVPGVLEARFALGDLDCSADSQLRSDDNPRTPLGIVCDPRWSWHEFCHVLLAAATGELEFPFAHSAGDAIAAILCDPQSALATSRGWRHATFPWVEEGRRHDRDPARGWGWTGSLYQREKFFAEALSDRRGYWAEQILSTTLFRLYRAIGGDAERVDKGKRVPDRRAREAAADYVVYLVTQALRLAGPASVATLRTPEQFLSAMQLADLGTSAVPTGLVTYPGGSVHKVVQWAFERQGLYGADLDGPADANEDGIYLEDWRDKQEDGTYAPISFLPEAEGRVGWHAPPSAVWVRRKADGGACDQSPVKKQANFVYVSVRNKRRKPATSVQVDVWVAALVGGKPPAFRDGSMWTLLGSKTASLPKATKTSHGRKTFGPFSWASPASGSYALLVSASWAGDRSNLDPAGGSPCATSTAKLDLTHVVACDDNLGVRIVTVS